MAPAMTCLIRPIILVTEEDNKARVSPPPQRPRLDPAPNPNGAGFGGSHQLDMLDGRVGQVSRPQHTACWVLGWVLTAC